MTLTTPFPPIITLSFCCRLIDELDDDALWQTIARQPRSLGHQLALKCGNQLIIPNLKFPKAHCFSHSYSTDCKADDFYFFSHVTKLRPNVKWKIGQNGSFMANLHKLGSNYQSAMTNFIKKENLQQGR